MERKKVKTGTVRSPACHSGLSALAGGCLHFSVHVLPHSQRLKRESEVLPGGGVLFLFSQARRSLSTDWPTLSRLVSSRTYSIDPRGDQKQPGHVKPAGNILARSSYSISRTINMKVTASIKSLSYLSTREVGFRERGKRVHLEILKAELESVSLSFFFLPSQKQRSERCHEVRAKLSEPQCVSAPALPGDHTPISTEDSTVGALAETPLGKPSLSENRK